ncbi:hypothetical protein ABZ438_08190 [Streptomyces sp. NPDC005786]|uniref:VG15 protein n=1 Tax=Streptomyces sp. NPDC005786 TaxID=3154891 RepID=UPI0033F29574
MASTASDGGEAADRYRRAQRGLSRLLLRDVGRLRRFLNPSRLQASFPDWLAAADEVVAQYGETSASLAADFFDGQRAAAEVPGDFTPPLADRPPPEQVEASLRWATHGIWAPESEGVTLTLDERLDVAERQAEAVAQKLVADQGRETIRQAVREDRQAVGYARAAALGACYFCKLMASRGMVYATAGTAGGDANESFLGDGTAKYHNLCNCCVIPVFRGQRFELSAHAAEWDRLYQEYAQGHSGDQLRLFRRALADHDVHPLP